jgi:hypothetical protein
VATTTTHLPYEYHVQNPNDASLTPSSAKEHHPRGTGVTPRDVVIDAASSASASAAIAASASRAISEKDANEHGVYTVDLTATHDRVSRPYNRSTSLRLRLRMA